MKNVEMERREVIEKCYDIAQKLVETDDWSLMSELDAAVYEWNREHWDCEIYMCEEDDHISVEDESFYFNN